MSPSPLPASTRSRPETLVQATLALGLPAMLEYGAYRLALRTGWLRRRTPIRNWQETPLRSWLIPGVPHTGPDYLAYRQAGRRLMGARDQAGDRRLMAVLQDGSDEIVTQAEEVLRGEMRLFGGPLRTLGFPPDWGSFVAEPESTAPARVELDRHWTDYLGETPSDVKLLWEPSRFAWVYPLSAAYRLTGEARFAEGCWRLIESWREANRPNAGPHWVSAQESAVRLVALVHCLEVQATWLGGQPERLAALAEMIAVHAARIPSTLGYARSLQNNHLVSEAAGLYTAGVVFPEFRQAARWRSLGRRTLVAALGRQIYADGGHVQHSLWYLRQVLEAGLWAAHLAQAADEPLPQATLASLRRGAELLWALVDPETGQAPNLGANDGGRFLPAVACPYADFRPVLQLAAAVVGTPALPEGPWDETAAWLRGGAAPAPARRHRPSQRDFPQAGVYPIGGGQSAGLFRCARFGSRPGHADQLHFDLRLRGAGVARDPGSYLYNAAPPWDNGLAKAEVHNTLLVDRCEPMRRAGPFLWLDWAQGRFLGRWGLADGLLEVVAGEHDGYRRLGVTHRRTIVRAGDDLWLVADDLLGVGEHSARAVWQLPDCQTAQLRGDTLSLAAAGGYVVIQMEAPGDLFAGPPLDLAVYRAGCRIAGQEASSAAETWGWWSPTYAARQPALTLVGETSGILPLRLLTWWVLGRHSQASLEVAWQPPGEGSAALERLVFEGESLAVGI